MTIVALPPAVAALLHFCALAVGSVSLIALFRTARVALGGARANSWTRGKEPPASDPPFMTRLNHAHQNVVENLGVFAAIVFAAFVAGRMEIVNPLSQWLVRLRLAQFATHLVSTSHTAVFVRASFFFPQVAIFAYWLLRLLNLA
jgi:uncharacterized MAPEG superfamily protein